MVATRGEALAMALYVITYARTLPALNRCYDEPNASVWAARLTKPQALCPTGGYSELIW